MGDKTPKPDISRQIDENLRRVFQEKLEEDVPNRFRELLDKLKQQDIEKK